MHIDVLSEYLSGRSSHYFWPQPSWIPSFPGLGQPLVKHVSTPLLKQPPLGLSFTVRFGPTPTFGSNILWLQRGFTTIQPGRNPKLPKWCLWEWVLGSQFTRQGAGLWTTLRALPPEPPGKSQVSSTTPGHGENRGIFVFLLVEFQGTPLKRTKGAGGPGQACQRPRRRLWAETPSGKKVSYREVCYVQTCKGSQCNSDSSGRQRSLQLSFLFNPTRTLTYAPKRRRFLRELVALNSGGSWIRF